MLRIREAAREDNDALLRLEAQSPQGRGITILVDRDDYFYRTQLYAHSKVLIAEEDDHVVGVMAYAIKEVFVAGERERVAYLYDLRGEASYRRSMKRGLLRLWQAALQGMEDAGAAFVYGHVKADNDGPLDIFARSGARRLSSFDVLSLPALRGRPPDLDPHLDALDAEVERIAPVVGARNLEPCDFHAAYARGAELGYLRGIFRIERGDSMAQLSAWDLSRILRGRVLRMPRSLRVLAGVLNPLSRILPVPRIPRVGEQMTYWQLFDPVCRGSMGKQLLKALLQQLRRLAHAEGIDVLTLFVTTDDPIGGLPRFLPQEVLRYETMARPLGKAELPEGPVYLDIRDV